MTGTMDSAPAWPVAGFIGLGSQGAPIVRRMVDAGMPTWLWARRADTLEPFRLSGAQFADSVEELGATATHVGICVVDDAGVREVCARLFPAMRQGSTIAIHSTIHPDTCREMEERAAGFGLYCIDAPVSGGEPAARAGTLTLMLGGDEAVVERAMPVFRTFGRLIVHLGDVGTGQYAKLINNTLLAANMALAHAAIEVGRTLGIEKQTLVRLVGESSGNSFGLGVCARMTSPAGFAHGGALLDKDVTLLGTVVPEGDSAYRILSEAAKPFIALTRSS